MIKWNSSTTYPTLHFHFGQKENKRENKSPEREEEQVKQYKKMYDNYTVANLKLVYKCQWMPLHGTITWFESEVKLRLPELKNAPELMPQRVCRVLDRKWYLDTCIHSINFSRKIDCLFSLLHDYCITYSMILFCTYLLLLAHFVNLFLD